MYNVILFLKSIENEKRAFSERSLEKMKNMNLEQSRLEYEAPMVQLIVVFDEDIVRTSQSDANGGEYGNDWL